MMLGAAVGAALATWLSMRFGRKRALPFGAAQEPKTGAGAPGRSDERSCTSACAAHISA